MLIHRFLYLLLLFPLQAHGNILVHERGWWYGDHLAEKYDIDIPLCEEIARFFAEEQATSAVDFGCGAGHYVRFFCNCSLLPGFRCEGYDGSPETTNLSQGLCHILDLSECVDLGEVFDWVISFETGEHIPKEFERNFFLNLDRHNAKGVILSWAIIEGGVHGHFNEQNNDYIKAIMSHYGYINDLETEQRLRDAAASFWFKDDLMVFRKKDTY